MSTVQYFDNTEHVYYIDRGDTLILTSSSGETSSVTFINGDEVYY